MRFSVVVGILSSILLVLPFSSFAQNSCPPDTERLNIGDTFEGLIDNNQAIIQACFSGSAGDVVSISLSRASGNLDTYLELTDVSGDDVYATNDDRSLLSTDSEIVFELSDDNPVIINVSRFNQESGTTEGQFVLALNAEVEEDTSQAETVRPDDCPILYDVINYAQTIEDEIDNRDYTYFYCFAGSAGDEVIIDASATSGNLDTLLVLTDIRFEEIYAENDDREIGNRDSRIVFELPESGPYLITMTRYNLEDGDTEGDFQLTIQINDGTFTDEDLFGIREPNPYECNRPVIRELNATQWLETTEGYNFRLNFGCEGLAVVSILGELFDVPYAFVDDVLQLEFNDQSYIVELLNDGKLTLTGDEIEFVFTDVGQCSDELVQDLNEGVWYLGQNDTFFRIDFLCGGVALVTLESVVVAYTYDFDTRQETLFINDFNSDPWTDVFILPGIQMSVETVEDPFIFTNVLTEIDDGSDADI